MDDNIIEVKKVSKEFKINKRKAGLLGAFHGLFNQKYKIIRALDNANFKIKKGEFVGLIGPNGAGKSTMIKILTGILAPSKGVVTVNGLVPYEKRKENAKGIGVVFGQRSQLWWDLPVKDSFDLLKAIYNVSDRDFKKRMKEFKEVLKLNKYLLQPVRKLSLGERMRCDLAASLLHNPPIVYLDEPTIGLDVESKHKIRKFLKEKNKQGTTIILTTHDMGDVEELCPRLIIIDKGKVLYDGSTAEIKKRLANQRYVIVNYSGKPPKMKLRDGIKIKKREEDIITYEVDADKANVCDFVKKIMKHEIDDIKIQEPSIEKVIRHIYKKGI